MTEIVNKFLLNGDKFMSKLHLRQPAFAYSACEPLTNYRERIQKFKETGYLNCIYKNELDKACFAHDTVFANSKDLSNRAVSEKILKDRAYEIALNPKYDGYQKDQV